MQSPKLGNLDSLEGQFLIAMPGMGDPRFERTVIFLCAHSQEGAMGFVVNRLLEKPSVPDFFTQLAIVSEEEAGSIPPALASRRLHSGGPVEPGRGFVLHSDDYRGDSTLDIEGSVGLTATLEILRAIATGRGPKRLMMALGYSGWAGGQLEEEIAANSWLTAPGNSALLFDVPVEGRYDRALRGIGIDPALLSGEAGHA
jgi:putative transcriptional regulator